MVKKDEKSTRLVGESSHMRPCKRSRAAAADGGLEKKLYVLFNYSGGWAHSLYALDVPSDNDGVPPPSATSFITTTVTTIVTTPEGSCTSSTTQTQRVIDGIVQDEEDRSTVESVLEFNGEWPAGMRFSTLGRKLYFLGGYRADSLGDLTYQSEVFVLDLDTFSSTTELRSYRHRPAQILKQAPPMTSGKINPISFVCDGHVFVLSARKVCPYSRRALVQFERLGGNQWKVLASPNFPRSFRFSGHVQVNRSVIVSGYVNNGDQWLYSYDLDYNQWSEFDTTGWTTVENFGFIISSGSTFIRGGIYGVFRNRSNAIPVVMRLEKQEGEGLVLSKDGMYDIIKYNLLSPQISSTLTTLGEDTMCFLEVGNPPAETDDPLDFNPAESHMSISMFNVHPPRFLGSAHYVTYPGRSFTIVDAYFV